MVTLHNQPRFPVPDPRREPGSASTCDGVREGRGQVWQPGQDAVAAGESLQYDPTAYDCLHQLTYEWPCLRCRPLRCSVVV